MKHIDCKYYLATDVFKGLCKRTKESILADDDNCEHFDKAPKCRHCVNFTSTELLLGLCKGESTAYPDMRAITCKEFSWS